MNKKGFTLVEILAVIVLISLLSVAAFASIRGIKKNVNTKAFEAKVKVLESAAIDYGEDHFNEIKESNKSFSGYSGNKCIEVSVADLYTGGYIKPDDVKDCNNINCILENPLKGEIYKYNGNEIDNDTYMYGVYVYVKDNSRAVKSEYMYVDGLCR